MIPRVAFFDKRAVSIKRHSRDIAHERPALGKVAILEGLETCKEFPMSLELTVTVFVAAYIVIVAIGHVLLVAAILKCLREDFIDGRPQRAAAGRATPDGEMKPLPVRSSPTKDLTAQGGADIEPWQAFGSRENAPLNFADQRQALDRDLRYVVTVTGSQC